MTEKQYSILWTSCGIWLLLFCMDSLWVSRKQESFAPGIGALDSDPYSAALWGTIIGSGGLLFMCWLVYRYAKFHTNSGKELFCSPSIFGLENDDSRSELINRWGNLLFLYFPTALVVGLFIQTSMTRIYSNKLGQLFDGGWFESRINALKSDCNAYSEFCFRIGGANSDEYFPIVTDLLPIVLFLVAMIYLFKWLRCYVL